jgi:spore germination cell wall hydrolase CwlJ-like protein
MRNTLVSNFFILTIFAIILSLVGIFVLDRKPVRIVSLENADIKLHHLTSDAKREIACLAENVYFEAAHEPEVGQLAVAFVTMNRVNSGKFADSICGVVKQKIGSTCQFSWWCETKPYAMSTNHVLTRTNNLLYNRIQDMAVNFYLNHERMRDPSKGALYYHADYVNPGWKLPKNIQIGRHIFYGEKNGRRYL